MKSKHEFEKKETRENVKLLKVEEHLLEPSRARNAALMKIKGKSTPTIKTLGKTDR